MKRVVYSLYIDIPNDELDWQKPYENDTLSKTERTKLVYIEYYDWLKSMHEKYAELVKADYKIFLHDDDWLKFKAHYNKNYPYITAYNVVNYYKIHLMYKLCETYDEVLYIDLDVIPATKLNFFDRWQITKNGIAILSNRQEIDTSISKLKSDAKNHERGVSITNRAPASKYWTTKALLIENGYSGENDIYNTGVVGISAEHASKLDYWNRFGEQLEKINFLLHEEDSMWPKHIQQNFGFDNEIMFSHNIKTNNVPTQNLIDGWHYVMDKLDYISNDSKFIHAITKKVGLIKSWYEKNCI